MAKSMNGQSSLFNLTICEGSSSAISSPGLGDGPTPSDSLAGTTPAPSGPAPVPVSRSRQPAPKLAGTIPAIFGRRGISSSRSAALQSSLVNRLKTRLDTAGSIVCAMTWKETVTPSGRSVCLLRASARSTSDNDSGLWPSPTRADAASARNSTATRYRIPPTGIHVGHTLVDMADLASWPTPNTPNGGRSVSIEKMSATGRTLDGRKHTVSLEHVAKFAGSWATPAARDYRSNEASEAHYAARLEQTRGKPLSEQAHQLSGPLATGSPVETGKRGQLNPALSRWLMGYPPAWDDCAAMGTPSSRKSRKPSSKRISPVQTEPRTVGAVGQRLKEPHLPTRAEKSSSSSEDPT